MYTQSLAQSPSSVFGPTEQGAATPSAIDNREDLLQRIRQLEEELGHLHSELQEHRVGPRRERLPTTRRSLTHKFAIDQHEGYLTVGLYDDGRPGELFLTMAKEGSTIGGLTDTIGILTSLALQYGVPVETLARKFEHVSFEPRGWTRDQTIRHASSVVDYVFRWLGMQFSESYRQEKLALLQGESTQADAHEAIRPAIPAFE